MTHYQTPDLMVFVLGHLNMKSAKTNLPLKDAVRVKSAELWLRMGEPLQATQELRKLTRRAWNHPWTQRVVWQVAQAAS